MQKYLRNACIILGQVISSLVLVGCSANTSDFVKEENKNVLPIVIPVATPTGMVTEIPIPTTTLIPTEIVTEIPVPTATLVPNEIVTETPMPTATLTPTEMVTETPIPTVTLAPTEMVTETPMPTATPTPVITAVPSNTPTTGAMDESAVGRELVKQKVYENIVSGVYSELANDNYEWWFRRKENHVPSGSGEFFDISKYQGIYLNKDATEEDKVVYLTIDCGYGSDNTAILLDIFKEQNIQVTFFVTSHFLKSNPKEVCRMAQEGHFVGNHTVTHPNLTKLTDEEIYNEIINCEEKYFEVTGRQMDLFFRSPGGDYSIRTMQITKDLGYHSFFWSIAYYDYDADDQPGKEYVLNHFETYHHNGAVILMHHDSDSNKEAMREVILSLKEQGYRFGSLEELCQ